MLNAFAFQPVDKPPLQYYLPDVGYYEHGEKLIRLCEQYPGDFGAYTPPAVIPAPPDGCLKDGAYYQCATDEWGTVCEYRVFGIMGHAVSFPLTDWARLDDYAFPAQPWYVTEPVETVCEMVRLHKEQYVFMDGGISLLERMSAIRGFENGLVDLYEDGMQINRLMDRLTDYYADRVKRLVAIGADGITLGDDYGTQRGLILSPELFRHAVKPRLARILKPAVDAGLYVHFHSCGYIEALLDDFKDLGVTSIWPQLPLFDMKRLRDRLRDLHIAIQIHTDRSNTMTHGTPHDVRALVEQEMRVFDIFNGGAWMYVEPDTGFPFTNIETLVKTIARYRK